MKQGLRNSLSIIMLILLAFIVAGCGKASTEQDTVNPLEARITALEDKVAAFQKGQISPDDLATLEKLTVEFSDELALLGVKVTALEDNQVGLNTLRKLTVEFSDELALLGVKVTALEDDVRKHHY